MGLDDITSDVEEEVKSLDGDEVEDFIDRFETVSQVVVGYDKDIEEIKEDIEDLEDALDSLETVLEVLIEEYRYLNDKVGDRDEKEFSLDDVGSDEGEDNSSSWKT